MWRKSIGIAFALLVCLFVCLFCLLACFLLFVGLGVVVVVGGGGGGEVVLFLCFLFWVFSVYLFSVYGFMQLVVFVGPAVIGGKYFSVGQNVKILPNVFITAILIGTIDFSHFIPLSVTLILVVGIKVSRKEHHLLTSFSCVLFFFFFFFTDQDAV